ncbi:hypothetical protein MUK42_15689, partial [Musa troglodytarum]
RQPKHTEIINPALPFVPPAPKSGTTYPGKTKASTPSRFVTFSLFLFFPLSLQSLESELAVLGFDSEGGILVLAVVGALLLRLLLCCIASLAQPQELQTHRHLPVANLEWCFSSSSSF